MATSKCGRCKINRRVPGRSLCRSCAKRKLAERLAWIRKRRRRRGCIDCLNKAVAGSLRCGKHTKRHREYQRRYYRKRRAA